MWKLYVKNGGLMLEYGKQIWITEFGWATSPDDPAQLYQDGLVYTKCLVISMADNVQKTIIYKWQSYVDDNYGLIWANDTDKPAYNALLQAGPALAQTTPIPEQLSFNIPIFQNTLRIYAFKSVNTNQYVFTMWAEDNRQIGVSISINAAALISSESGNYFASQS